MRRSAGNSGFFLVILIAGVLTSLATNVQGAPPITNADWSVLNTDGIIGTNGQVNATAYHKGNLYVGGSFSVAGNAMAGNIAKWDGGKWSSMSQGLKGGWMNSVNAIVLDSNGNLFAGGQFDSAGGAPCRGVAQWNGAGWSSMGSGTKGLVNALAFGHDGKLYAAGYFDTIGGVYARNIAKWDGYRWDTLGPGLKNLIKALAFDRNGNLYAGGKELMQWNGSYWKRIDSGSAYSSIYALALDTGGELLVGGDFAKIGGLSSSYCAKWDGASWKYYSSGWNPFLRCINAIACDKNGNVHLGGYNLLHFSGEKGLWYGKGHNYSCSGVYSDDGFATGEIRAVSCGDNGAVFTGGTFGSLLKYNYEEGRRYGVTCNHIVQWRDTAITILGSSNGSQYISEIISDRLGRLYAGGNFSSLYGVDAPCIAMREAGQWKSMGSGLNGAVYTLATDASGMLYAGGNFDSAGGIPAKRVAQWDGTKWRALGKGLNKRPEIISCDRKGNLYAGGMFDSAGGIRAQRIARWNGSRWDSLGSGFKDSTNRATVNAIAFDSAGNLMAGGLCTRYRNIAVWDGNVWKPFGTGTDWEIEQILIYKGEDIFITTVRGWASVVSRWYGNGWAGIFGSDTGIYDTDLDSSGNLYIAGAFKEHILQWDGLGLRSLGSGTDNSVYEISIADSTLYAAGAFLIAGDNLSPYFAKVNTHVLSSEVKPRPRASIGPGPALVLRGGSKRLQNLPSGPGRIELFSLAGKLIFSCELPKSTGPQSIKLPFLPRSPLIGRVVLTEGLVIKQLIQLSIMHAY